MKEILKLRKMQRRLFNSGGEPYNQKDNMKILSMKDILKLSLSKVIIEDTFLEKI